MIVLYLISDEVVIYFDVFGPCLKDRVVGKNYDKYVVAVVLWDAVVIC